MWGPSPDYWQFAEKATEKMSNRNGNSTRPSWQESWFFDRRFESETSAVGCERSALDEITGSPMPWLQICLRSKRELSVPIQKTLGKNRSRCRQAADGLLGQACTVRRSMLPMKSCRSAGRIGPHGRIGHLNGERTVDGRPFRGSVLIGGEFRRERKHVEFEQRKRSRARTKLQISPYCRLADRYEGVRPW